MRINRNTVIKNVALFSVFLLSAVIIPVLSNPVTTHAVNDCSPNSIVYGGASWFNGAGVNICSKGDDGNNYVNNSKGVSILSGWKWECAELINRFYLTQGWISANWFGNASQLINYIPSGFNAQYPNKISYINQGDAITLDNGGNGHVALVDSINGTTIGTINQNTQNVRANSTLSGSLSSGTGSLSSWLPSYTFQAIIHAPTGTPPPPVISTLKTIATSDGHIQTFKITNGTLSENWYNWGAGSNRYGIWTQPVGMPSTPIGAPAIVQRTGQNKIDVFVRGSNNQIYETWYDYQYGTWGGWINMGGNVTSDPQTIDTSDAHEQVFGTGSNLVQQNWFNPNVSVNNFSGWTTSHGLPANAVGSPAVALRSGQTAIDEFVRGGDNQIYETWYDISNSNWGGWKAMGGYVTSDPQVTTTSDGHDQVFGTGSNLVKQSWYYVNGDVGGWTTSAGLPSVTTTSSPASVLRTGQGRIDEFITGSNNQVYQTWYDSGVGNWGPWFNMGGTTTSDPQGIATSDGHDQIFGTNNSAVAQNWFDRVTGYIGGWITF
jgi:hypothetical protein